MPATLNWAEAAALPLTALTAWELLFDRLHIFRSSGTPAKSLLIVNGAGGVGSILIQLARRLTDLTVIATASRPETIAWAEELGAHHVIDHHRPLREELARVGIRTVEFIASLANSGRNLPQYAEIIAAQGGLCLIDDVKSFDIVPFRQKSVTVAWEGMFTRSLYRTADMIQQHHILDEIARLVDAGVLRTTFSREVGLMNAAHLKAVRRLLESSRSIGKIALSGFPARAA